MPTIPDDFTVIGNLFNIFGIATAKMHLPKLILVLGTKCYCEMECLRVLGYTNAAD